MKIKDLLEITDSRVNVDVNIFKNRAAFNKKQSIINLEAFSKNLLKMIEEDEVPNLEICSIYPTARSWLNNDLIEILTINCIAISELNKEKEN